MKTQKAKVEYKELQRRKRISNSLKGSIPKNIKEFISGGIKFRKGVPSWNMGIKHSEKHKENLSVAWIRRKTEGNYLKSHSEETKKKIGLKNKGNKHTFKTKLKISKKNKGKHSSPKTEFKKGHRWTEEINKKRLKNNTMKGESHWCWKGGITSENEKIRKSQEYKLWRNTIFIRDSWTCQKCGEIGGVLHVHHIKPFSLYPKLRFDVDNGIVYCMGCHKQTDTYGGKLYKIVKLNNREDYLKYNG